MRAWPIILFLSIGGCFPPAPEVSEAADTSASEDTASDADTSASEDTAPDADIASDSVAGDSAAPTDTTSTDTTSTDTTSTDTTSTDTMSTDTTSGDTVADVDSVEADTSAPECESDSDCDHLDVAPCVSGSCDDGTCVAQQEIGACDDGDPCTTEDTCTETGCVGRPWTDAEAQGWGVILGGAGVDLGADLAIHPSGELSVVGGFTETIDTGTETLTASGSASAPDVLIARFDRSGALLWTAVAGGDSADFGLLAQTDGEELVVAGWFGGTAMFGSASTAVSITADGDGESFVARYSADGALVSVWRVPGFVRALAPAPSGDVLVLGELTTAVVFSSDGGDISVTPLGSSPDVYIARIAPSGSVVWVAQVGTTDEGGLDLDSVPVPFIASDLTVATFDALVGPFAVYSESGAGVSSGLGNGDTTAQAVLTVDMEGGLVSAVTHPYDLEGGVASFDLLTSAVRTENNGLTGTGYRFEQTGGQTTFNVILERDGEAVVLGGSYQVGSGSISPIDATALPAGGFAISGLFSGTLVLDDTPLAPAVSSPDLARYVGRYAADGTAQSGLVLTGGGVEVDDFPYKSIDSVRAATSLRLAPVRWRAAPSGGLCWSGTPSAGTSDALGVPTGHLGAGGQRDAMLGCIPIAAVCGCQTSP